MAEEAHPAYRDTWLWNTGFSAYWFATTYKWFILLQVVVPSQVAALVPGGEKNSAWGLVFGLGALWGMLGPALFGGWSDRFDSKWGHRQPFILAGIVVTVPALLLLAWAPSMLWLVVGYLVLQIGEDLGQGPYSAMMPEIVPKERMGRASAVMNLLQSAARIVAGVVYAMVSTITGTYIAVAIVQVLGGGATLWTIRDVRRVGPAPVKSTESFWKRWAKPFQSADFRWVWFTRFLSTLAFTMIANYLLYYLKDMFASYKFLQLDLKDAQTTTIFLAMTMSLLGIIGALVAAKFTDSWGRKPLIYLSGSVIGAVLVPFALTRDVTTLVALTVPFGIALGVYVSADWALATDVLPDKQEAGTQMGVWSMSVTSVQIIAGVAGPLVDWGNRLGRGFGYLGLIWTAGAIFVLSTVLIRKVKTAK